MVLSTARTSTNRLSATASGATAAGGASTEREAAVAPPQAPTAKAMAKRLERMKF